MELDFSQIDLQQEATKKERVYFGIILLLVLVAFARWLYLPKIAETKVAYVKAKNTAMQVDTLKKFAELKLPQIELPRQLSVVGGAGFANALEASTRPKQDLMVHVVRSITSNEWLRNLNFTGMSFGADTDKGSHIIVPLTIEVDGRYSDVVEYLRKLERTDRLVIANNIELFQADARSQKVRAKINVDIYVVKTAAEATAAAEK